LCVSVHWGSDDKLRADCPPEFHWSTFVEVVNKSNKVVRVGSIWDDYAVCSG